MAKLDGSEQVLAVSTEILDQIGRFQGFRPFNSEIEVSRSLIAICGHARFLPRTEDLEHGDAGLAHLQVIPYAILVPRSRQSVFCFRRPSKGGDSRLAERSSMGIGGHVNPEDRDGTVKNWDYPPWTLYQGLRREVFEEVGVEVTGSHLAGLLYDGSNDVGRRHLGVVAVCEVDTPQVNPNPAEVEPVGWLTAAELRQLPVGEWETWSAILVDSIDQVLSPLLAVG